MTRAHATPRTCAAAFALLAAGCGASDRFVAIGSCNASHSAAGVARLEANDRVGSIVITPSTADEVAVTATVSVHESLRERYPAADAARDLKIAVDGDRLVVGDNHHDERDTDFEIDLVISAPARLAWKLATGVGKVEATAAGNAIDASTGVGDIRVNGAVAVLAASSGVGRIDADLETLAGGTLHCGTGDLRLVVARGGITAKLSCTTGTGSVSITVPSGFSADAALETGTGHLSIEGAALEVKRNFVGGAARGRLGNGGPPLVATSGTGSVTLQVRR